MNTLNINFNEDTHNTWIGGATDFSLNTEPSDVLIEIQKVLSFDLNAMRLSGRNNSDDLFLYIRKKFSDLDPNTLYEFQYEVDIITDMPTGCLGVGGGGADAVFFRAGTSSFEPTEITQGGTTFETWCRVKQPNTVYYGNQSQDGLLSKVIGTIANTQTDCGGNKIFEEKKLTSNKKVITKTNSFGEVWHHFGIDSGYESYSEVYIKSIKIIYNKFEPQRKKILALHGGGETGESFKNQFGMQQLISSLPNFEIIFTTAPTNNLWIQDPPGGKDNPTTDPSWADDSIFHIDSLIREHGYIHGIIGYSQGAAMIPVYLSRRTNLFHFAIMYCGYLPETHLGLIESINEIAPFAINSIVFSGENDFNFKDLARGLANKFNNSLYIRSLTAGHHLPFNSDPTFTQIIDFIENTQFPTPTPTPIATPTPTPINSEKTIFPIQLSTENYTIASGWYGVNEKEPSEFDLKLLPPGTLYKALQTNNAGTSRVVFNPSLPSNIPQAFSKLKCGYSYELIFNKSNQEIRIPNFVWNKNNSSPRGKITN